MIKLKARDLLVKCFKVKYDDKKLLSPYELKFIIRRIARLNSLYFEHVTLVPDIETEIEINNLGKWLFGVKGYMGHYKQNINENKKEIEIYIPKEQNAFNLIHSSLKYLKEKEVLKLIEIISSP